MTADNERTDRRSHGCPAALVAARRGGSAPDRYVAPSDAEGSRMAALVAELAGGKPDIDVLSRTARASGYDLEAVPEVPGSVLLRELEGERRGGGAYLVRLRATSRLVVQAPHTFYDEGTLPLACELFQRTSAAALFVETAHRYKAAEADEHGDYPADVAHAPASLFQAATRGILEAKKDAVIVQLHGFGARENDSAVVLSTGAAEPADAFLRRASALLGPVVPGRTVRFPDETSELGATTNVQGILARSVGARFLHVELSADLRRTLLDDLGLRSRFLDALGRTVEPR